MEKAIKMYYSVSEAAGIIGESTTLVRYWANQFPEFIKPARNKKGNRMFTASDMDYLVRIHSLVKESGMTLEGARQALKTNKNKIDSRIEIAGRLSKIRSDLVEILKRLDEGDSENESR